MIGFGKVPADLLQAALLAAKENRLSWRVTDQHGRSCNGGSADPIALGDWSPVVDDPKPCVRGWHTTKTPHKWRGCRVWLVEGKGEASGPTYDDKRCWSSVRPLAEADPKQCLSASVFVRCANLTRANLTDANLTDANLTGANLTGANLTRVNLTRADLRGADLYGAGLTGANLTGANLTGANLYGANLYGANLTDANLRGANLTRANLYGADLTGANLTRADLFGADLFGANLTGANLTGAGLSFADLSDVDLTGARRLHNPPPGWSVVGSGYLDR